MKSDADPYRYHIRVEGVLNQRWTDWMDGFAMTTRDDGLTLLTGEVRDQSDLLGILNRLHGLGLPLTLVTRMTCPCSSARCTHRISCLKCVEHESERGAFPACMRRRSNWERQICKLATR